ncbi:MAG: phospho-N-acetylmuramoyl-pentapeptide-transferase [Rikenellaceae bacterium]
MLYHLEQYLSGIYDIPGAGMWTYLSFRAGMAVILALIIGMVFGKRIILALQRRQIGEDVRNLGLEGQLQKKGTPTMGGLIILAAILVPILLLGDLTNVYVQVMIVATVWLGVIGFLDDYIKVAKKNKEGLKGRFKVFGQIGLGLIVGITMWQSPDVVVSDKIDNMADTTNVEYVINRMGGSTTFATPSHKSIETTIPFVKDNEFNYSELIPDKWNDDLGWLLYVLVAIFIITGVSNCANLTDGLDGLAAGVSASIVVVLGIFAYLSGNIIYAEYLDIMYIPNSGELVVFAAAFVGALLGFLWYNCYPAQVFMGDTGSLAIGGIIAVMALLIRKELLLPILCGVFFVEGLSVIAQVSYFKYTKRRYGEGRRIFLMAPLHHHYQKSGYIENKIVVRFWLVQILLAAITIITLKIR